MLMIKLVGLFLSMSFTSAFAGSCDSATYTPAKLAEIANASALKRYACPTCGGGELNNAYIALPANYNPNKVYPTIIFMHGHGEGYKSGSSIDHRICRLTITGMLTKSNLDKLTGRVAGKIDGINTNYEFIVIANQAHENAAGSEYAFASGSYDANGEPIYTKNNTEVLSVLNFFKDTQGIKIDPERIYVTGLSQGGQNTYRMMLKYPKMIAAAVPVATAGHGLNLSMCRSKHIPTWHMHGDKDTAASYYQGSQRVLEHNNCPGTDIASLSTFPGYGHDVWSNTYKNIFENSNGILDIAGTPEIENNSIYEWMCSFTANGGTSNIGCVGRTPGVQQPPANQAPVVNAISNKVMEEDQSLIVNITASDADGDNLALAFAQALPNFASFNAASGVLELNPKAGDAGSYNFSVTANDGQVNSAPVNFSVQVNAPVVVPEPPVDEDVNLALNFPEAERNRYFSDSVLAPYDAYKAFNNSTDNASRWVSLNNGLQHHLGVKLMKKSEISRVVIKNGYNASSNPIKNLQIEYQNDDSVWKVIPESVRNNNSNVNLEILFNSPIIADSIRLVVFDNDNARVKEFEIYGREYLAVATQTNWLHLEANNWGTLYLQYFGTLGNADNTRIKVKQLGYTHLEFYVKHVSGINDPSILGIGLVANFTHYEVNLKNYLTSLPNNWSKVSIPLADFKFDAAHLDKGIYRLKIRRYGSVDHEFGIDEIRFTGSNVSPLVYFGDSYEKSAIEGLVEENPTQLQLLEINDEGGV
ncbi:MAG: discoidin domain-containing protein [Bacteriovoracaceae bacterium]|nr:discoidin domain-containing protein [Bacteriovoracaceae bacterium]